MHPSELPSEILTTMMPPMRIHEHIEHRGLTGAKYTKRKSRSKIARESKKRNR